MRRFTFFPLLPLLALGATASCTGVVAADVEAADARVVRAVAAADALRSSLLKTVQEALTASGAVGAISSCQQVAPVLTGAAQRPDLIIGRTSSKLRNPKNATPAWAAPLLLQLQQQEPEKRHPLSTPLSEGRLGVVVPIVAAKPCLTCHGKDVGSDVLAALARLYPDDKAVGYAEGDLRGAFFVEVR